MAIDDNAARNRVLVRTSWISTVGNAVLSAAKITVGALAGSLAVLGDGIDSATDVVISVVMIFTARIVGKPPTKKYPYGYEKAETIATKFFRSSSSMPACRCSYRPLRACSLPNPN